MFDTTALPAPAAAVFSPPIASDNTAALTQILEALEIEVVPTHVRRRPRQTCAGQTLPRILADHGEAHLTLLLRTIVESEGNELALIGPVINAVSAVMRAKPEWPEKGLAWIEAFDELDLMALQKRAVPLGKLQGMSGSGALAGMLIDRLTPILDPVDPVPPSKLSLNERREAAQQRKAEDQARRLAVQIKVNGERIEIGRELIKMKAAAGYRQFRRSACRRFPDVIPNDIPELLRVAERYGDRPEIWQAAPWCVLSALTSVSTPPEVRASAEAKIEAGERVNAKDVASLR